MSTLRNRSGYSAESRAPTSEMRSMRISSSNDYASRTAPEKWSSLSRGTEPSDEEMIAAEENVSRLERMSPEQRLNEWLSGAPDLPTKDDISNIEHTASMSLHFKKEAGSDRISAKVYSSEELAKIFKESNASDLSSTFIFPSEIKAEVVRSDFPHQTNLHCSALKNFYNHFTDSGEMVLMPVYPTDELNGKVSQSPFVITDTSPVNSEHYELFSRYGRLTPEQLESEITKSRADPSSVIIPQNSTMAAILKLNASTSGSEFTEPFSKDFTWNLHNDQITTRMSNVSDIISKYRKAHASVGTLKSFSLADGLQFELKRELDAKSKEHKSPSLMDSEVFAWTGTNGTKDSRLVAMDRMDEEGARNLHTNLQKSEAHAVVLFHLKYKKVHAHPKGGRHHHHVKKAAYYEHHEHHGGY